MKPLKVPYSASHFDRLFISIFCTCLLAFKALGTAQPGNALPGDQHWDNQFGFVGANNTLRTVNVLGGKVYIGGTLTAAGNTAANYIAGYDGTNWFQLNNGVSGYAYDFTYVFALANDGTNLYVGGLFTNADDSGAINIARWDGSSFHPLGGAPNSEVEAIKISGAKFFAGGFFTDIGNVSANYIAQWTGTTWQPLGAGLNGNVQALEYDGTYLYAGGTFSQAGSVAANNIARWNGANWSAMGTGFSGTVSALCSVNGNLYAGGTFTNGSLSITNLACWNGSSWSAVGLGPNGVVQSLVTDGTNLYVGGNFTQINGMAANLVAMYDGANWHALGTGLQGPVKGLKVYGMALDSQDRLFVAGYFSEAGSVGASDVAGWDGTNWFALGATASKGMTMTPAFGQVTGLFSDGVNIYAGGTFTEAGSQIIDQVARWDGTNWWPMGASTPGAGVEPGPDTFATAFGGALYAGGNFTNIGPYAISYIGYWDGNNWNPLDGTVDSGVEAMAYDGNFLWVGGTFANVDGTQNPGLAIIQDGIWYPGYYYVTGGSQFVAALAWDGVNDNLYAGGSFTSAYYYYNGSVPANNIAVYNENSDEWTALGSGVNGTVDAILVTNGIVYVGGSFTTAGGVSVNNIAKWNGTSWSALGSGVTNPNGYSANVTALAMIGNTLYVAGSFTNAGSVYAAGLAAWNGTNWSGLGSGLFYSGDDEAGSANALVANGNDLYVGGFFDWAGDKPSGYFAHWNNQLDFYPPPHPFLSRESWLPGNQFQFRVGGTSGESYILQASTNFAQWTPLFTNSATLYDFTDTNALHYPHRFYRAVLGP